MPHMLSVGTSVKRYKCRQIHKNYLKVKSELTPELKYDATYPATYINREY